MEGDVLNPEGKPFERKEGDLLLVAVYTYSCTCTPLPIIGLPLSFQKAFLRGLEHLLPLSTITLAPDITLNSSPSHSFLHHFPMYTRLPPPNISLLSFFHEPFLLTLYHLLPSPAITLVPGITMLSLPSPSSTLFFTPSYPSSLPIFIPLSLSPQDISPSSPPSPTPPSLT